MNAINIVEEHVVKRNLCTVCKNYCFTIKMVNHKIPHCTDCYRNVVNAKRREQRKQKKADDTCKCHDGMDIRGRCDYIYEKKAFLKCPARVDTAYFCLMNDWETYDKLQKQSKRSYCEDGEKEIIRMFCHHTLGLKSIDDKRKVIEMYYEDKRREQEEEAEGY